MMISKYLGAIRRRLARPHLEKAKSAQQQERWAEAYKAYGDALRKYTSFGTLVQMGHMSKEMGDFILAEAHYTEALEMKPQDWDLHVQLGHLFNRVGDLATARTWYLKADHMHPTAEISELLHALENQHTVEGTTQLRSETLQHMDAGRFEKALPGAIALYNVHGLKDFDVILGHALRETGHYVHAQDMYSKYFERCMASSAKNLKDAVFQMVRILEINGNHGEIIAFLGRFKYMTFNKGIYSDFNDELSSLLRVHVTKVYGVFR
ncbi:tetratricopeptide repeat protein [Agrobacterium rosae]|uniref:tetratricopeptide repeat protein n=1 Tax=Agrobacterium rosae TaxID=1972867 RepID=UPI003B9FE653